MFAVRNPLASGAILLALFSIHCGSSDEGSSTGSDQGIGSGPSSGSAPGASSGNGGQGSSAGPLNEDGGLGLSNGSSGVAASGSDSTGSTGSSTGGTGSSGSATGSSGASSGSSTGGTGTTIAHGPTGPAALATALGFPKTNGAQTFVVGLGNGMTAVNPFGGSYALGTPLHIIENYLSGQDGFSNDWLTWNTDANGKGAFVNKVFDGAKANGAVPMFTVYQVAPFNNYASGGFGCVSDKTCMTNWWAGYKTMLTRIASYNLPAMVNIEPDMTGYAQLAAKNNDPTTVVARVGSASSDCSGQPDTFVGMTSCIVRMRNAIAPKAYLGFNVSTWMGNAQALTFMSAMGAGAGDFLVMQTQDRDVGCYEIGGSSCTGQNPAPHYWTDADWTTFVANAKAFHTKLNLPLVWWQTPLGVASSTAGKNPKASYGYRDNRVQYFFGHMADLVNAGAMGAVFGQGEGTQADISTDILPNGQHQFKNALTSYNASPMTIN